MVRLHIRVTDAMLDTRDEGSDYEGIGAARKAAIEAATDIAADAIKEGAAVAVVEARVEETDGTVRARVVISMSATPLKIVAQAGAPLNKFAVVPS